MLTHRSKAVISHKGLYVRILLSVRVVLAVRGTQMKALILSFTSNPVTGETRVLSWAMATIGMVYYNMAWAVHPRFGGLNASESGYLAHLFTNIGLLHVAHQHAYVTRS